MKDWSAISVVILTLGLAAFVPANLDGVPDVLDGDTVFVAGARVRLEGIDAPEMDQVCLTSSGECWRCGEEARARLAEKIDRQFITCRANGEDRYGRTLATCRLGLSDVDLNAWMVSEGLALSFVRYSHRYDGDEAAARESRRGLWAGAFIAPWDWRHRTADTTVLGAEAVPLKGRASLLRGQPKEACP
jgi:endonuclease YncB( thermonuclease family)